MATKEELPASSTAGGDSAAAEAAPAPVPPPAVRAAPAPATSTEEYPDPDEDDLDDLDDVLDQFSSTPNASGPGRPGAAASHESLTGSTLPPSTSTNSDPSKAAVNTGAKASAPIGADAASEVEAEAFAEQLEKEMAALMSEIDSSPTMQAQIDKMMAELSMGAPGADAEGMKEAALRGMRDAVQDGSAAKNAAAAATATSAGATSAADASFQDTIRRTMERMQASGEQASAAAADPSSGEADMLEALLREMGGAGEGGDEDFSKMLLGMMEQLTNKDILYEPMKDLRDKFPAWLRDNDGKVPKADWDRYVEQQKLVGEIVGRFQRDGYSDENAEDREFIVERMQKMQAAGSPPADLVGDMNPQEALGDLDAGCPQQ